MKAPRYPLKLELELDDYAGYTGTNNRLPLAAASAMLPMQSAIKERRQWLLMVHEQHHSLVQAMEHGEGTRALALATEHVQIAQRNLAYARERERERPEVA